MNIKTSRKTGARILDRSQSKTLVDEYVAKELSRRRMLAGVLGLGAMSLGAPSLIGCSSSSTSTPTPPGGGNGETPEGTDPNNPGGTTGGTKHLTGLGYDESDRAAALTAALAETVGLSMIKPGESVYLRINSNSGDPYPYSTSPDTLIQVGNLLNDIGVTDIRVGDRSFWGDTGTAANLQRNGMTAAAKKIGTTAVVYDDDVDWVTLESDTHPNWNGAIRLPKPVMEADHIIILSVVKTHFISQITMSLKIALGLVHADDRSRTGNLKTHDTKVLYKQVSQINKAFTPSLVIQDGYKAVIQGGPTVNDEAPSPAPDGTKGKAGDPKIFIVSTDRIAADVAGIAVLQTISPEFELVHKTKPFANPMIAQAIKDGLGISSPEEMDLSGPTVPNLDELKAKIGIA